MACLPESYEGVIVSCTRQYAGRPSAAATTVADVTVVSCSFSVLASRAQSCAEASAGRKRRTNALLSALNIAPRTSAHEIRRVVDAAAALVLRHLRERAERAAAIDLAIGRVRGEDRRRRLALLAPLLERGQRVE